MTMLVFSCLQRRPWWHALLTLEQGVAACEAAAASPDGAALAAAHDTLVQALIAADVPDVATAIAVELASRPSAVGEHAPSGLPAGLRAALRRDLAVIARLARDDLTARVRACGVADAVPLRELAPSTRDQVSAEPLARLRAALLEQDEDQRLQRVEAWFARHGAGPAALHPALRWAGGALLPVAHPDAADLDDLLGLGPALARLRENTEALLRGAPAHDTLLYGPRGSGKSTAVRGLLARYQGDGLRLVEVPLDELHALPGLIERLRALPQRFVLFVDDLAFDDGDQRYRPLKSLLEGGLTKRPANVVVYATSNRRHLLRERHRDRPDPLDDDVHGWDTHHERLALADRFGLTLTFPDANQRRYLEVVLGLVERHGLQVEDVRERAIRFAEWGNGYSGRTARQFVDQLLQALP